MAINLNPSTTFTSAVLIGDTSSAATGYQTPHMSTVTVNGAVVPVSAALEVQSIEGGFLPPRMTQAQIDALTPVAGMTVWNSDLNTLQSYGNSGVASFGSMIQLATGTFDNTAFSSYYATPRLLIANPGVGKAVLVHRTSIKKVYGGVAFANGGQVRMQYSSVNHGAGTAAWATDILASDITSIQDLIMNTTGLSDNGGVNVNLISNQGVYLSNQTAVFTAGAGSTFTYYIWYSVVSL